MAILDGVIKPLYSKAKGIILPWTHTKAVYNDSGEVLDDIINEMEEKLGTLCVYEDVDTNTCGTGIYFGKVSNNPYITSMETMGLLISMITTDSSSMQLFFPLYGPQRRYTRVKPLSTGSWGKWMIPYNGMDKYIQLGTFTSNGYTELSFSTDLNGFANFILAIYHTNGRILATTTIPMAYFTSTQDIGDEYSHVVQFTDNGTTYQLNVYYNTDTSVYGKMNADYSTGAIQGAVFVGGKLTY